MAFFEYSFLFDLLTICGVFLLVIYGLFAYLQNRWTKKGIPFSNVHPIFGNLKDVVLKRKVMIDAIRDFYLEHKNKPFITFYSMFQPSVMINDMELVKSVLISDFSTFIDRNFHASSSDPLLYNNMFNLKGQKWRNLRTKLNPTFTSGKMKRMFELIDACGKCLVTCLEKETETNGEVYVKDLCSRFTTDVIATCAFGIEGNAMKDPGSLFRKMMTKAMTFDIIQTILLQIIFLAPWLMEKLKLRLTKHDVEDYFRKIVWDTVEYREKNNVVRNDFLDLLMQIRKMGRLKDDDELDKEEVLEESSDKIDMDGDTFVAQSFLFLAAAFDTSSSLMSYALYEMALHPDVQKKVYNEITTVLAKHGGKITYDAVQDMTYLHMVTQDLDGDRFVAQSFLFLTAGFDTSSSLMSYALYEMALHPDVQNKVYNEIATELAKHGGKVTYDAVQDMTYLHMVAQEANGEVEIKEFSSRFTTDVIATCAFGIEGNALKDPKSVFRKMMHKAVNLDLVQTFITQLMIFFPWVVEKLKLSVTRHDVTEYFRKTVWDTVEYREKNNVVRNDFLQLLMQIRKMGRLKDDDELDKGEVLDDSDDKIDLDGDRLVAQSYIFLVAGFDTSSSLMSYALYEMALHPDVQKKLYNEITTVLENHGGKVTYDAVQDMTYLHMVAQETLRKYPALVILDRRVTRPYRLPGTAIELSPGDSVMIPVTGIHNDPDLYPEPQRFDPERFSEEQKRTRPACAFLGFGDGPRHCIGMRMGYLQSKVGLIYTLLQYEVLPTVSTPIPLKFKSGVFLQVDGGVPLRLKKRAS